MIEDNDTLVIDVRNEFEVLMGSFKGAVNPKTKNFTDFKAFVKKNLANSKRKKIVEMYGMKIATEYLESQGWKVDDTSTGTFDLTCYKDEKTLLVEVKGIQAEFGRRSLIAVAFLSGFLDVVDAFQGA